MKLRPFLECLLCILGFAASANALTEAPVSGPKVFPIAGFIHRFGNDIEISLTNTTGRLYQMRSKEEQTQLVLTRLGDGDFIMAAGLIDPDSGTVMIQSIDLVGLRDMIGLWNTQDSEGVVNFRNYSEMNITHHLEGSTNEVVRGQNFKYSVVPSFTQNSWIMFLSDDKQTQMGLLDLKANRATIQLMNSETGNVSRILQLQKLN